MDGINVWWQGRPSERFWLGVAQRDGESVVISVPCGSGRSTAAGSHPLIRHVRSGDAVFLFDEQRGAIVACATSRGRVLKRNVASLRPGRHTDAQPARLERQPSWLVRLGAPVALDEAVPLARIAPLQSELFPALRRLEDVVGAPLHYPFALGSAHETHLLPGRVFKLPALFVEACPALVSAAGACRTASQ